MKSKYKLKSSAVKLLSTNSWAQLRRGVSPSRAACRQASCNVRISIIQQQKLLWSSRGIAGDRSNENSWRSCFSALHSDRLRNARHYAKQRFVAQFFCVARAAIGLALPLSPNGHALRISTAPARAADDHASDRGCSNPEHAGRRQSLCTGDRRTAGSGGALGQPLVSLRSRLLTSSSRHGVTTNRG